MNPGQSIFLLPFANDDELAVGILVRFDDFVEGRDFDAVDGDRTHRCMRKHEADCRPIRTQQRRDDRWWKRPEWVEVWVKAAVAVARLVVDLFLG